MERKPKTYWAGYCSDKPDFSYCVTPDNYGRLYTTRKEARKYYEDVRKVCVIEVKP